MDTSRNQDEANKCDLDLDLVPYRGPLVFEKGEKSSVITVMIKQDDQEEETEFFDMKIGSIHKRLKRDLERDLKRNPSSQSIPQPKRQKREQIVTILGKILKPGIIFCIDH